MSSFLSEIIPPACAACGQPADAGGVFCASCRERRSPFTAFCASCGHPAPVPLERCRLCERPRQYDRAIVRHPYRGVAGWVIKAVKYRYSVRGIQAVRTLVGDVSGLSGYDAVAVVPSVPLRRFARFAHPASIAAKEVSRQTGIPISNCLKRVRRTKRQAFLSTSRRRSNVAGAFVYRHGTGHCPLKILIVDDILSSGATVNECARVLKEAGAAVVDVFALTKGANRP